MKKAVEPKKPGYYWILNEGEKKWCVVERQKTCDRGYHWWIIGSEMEVSWFELRVVKVRARRIEPPNVVRRRKEKVDGNQNFEGKKILIIKDYPGKFLKHRKALDPHFTLQTKDDELVVLARFRPDGPGLDAARILCRQLDEIESV